MQLLNGTMERLGAPFQPSSPRPVHSVPPPTGWSTPSRHCPGGGSSRALFVRNEPGLTQNRRVTQRAL
jgi:hypothetical protein